ncbi:glycoside hydrolase family 13 protein [Streptomyces tubbatahanensis]|uniref:Glycoside hydrolase family 13 protein n=1 Tax=Streptomyces tubbatahanensis TaxID=2923272 RepID=A0ABY3XZZ0_9ACTN|nr:glycoside hydrolase family 13 protein [Streptomyces tubbatahanensis]UNT00073.1 glycoside hydrolase family 13 protein [Streptomyces tubbatahanensis]
MPLTTPAPPSSPAPAGSWWRDAVIYQIYVRSFSDSDGDGLGDLPGITARLDHVADLGADAVWLTPFYASPMADGGYDVADYRAVDPRFGTLQDADRLLARAHALGLRVLMDIVPNHTSETHTWFRQALASAPGSRERARYVFRDGRDGGQAPPTDWRSVFGGPAWERTGDGQWYLHLFAPQQPDLNWNNPEVVAEFHDVLRFWLDRGVDGFRFDVCHGMAKDLTEPLRDLGPDQTHHKIVGQGWDGAHPFWDRDEVHDLLRGFRRVTDAYTPPRLGVAESWAGLERRALYTRPDELHQAFNFDFLGATWDAAALRTTIDRSLTLAAAHGAAPTWVFSNHDVIRHASRLALPPGTDEEEWLRLGGAAPHLPAGAVRDRARAAALLLLALPGAAYLYQGEELGLPEVADLAWEALADPVSRRSGGERKGRDGCRVPLPWDPGGPSYGFGPGPEPAWLPQPDTFGPLSVASQRADPGSTLHLYRRALRLRREAGPGESLVWSARAPADVLDFTVGPLRCVVNLGAEEVPLHGDAEPLLSSAGRRGATSCLPPDAAVWLAADPGARYPSSGSGTPV